MALVCFSFFIVQRQVLLTISLDPDEIFSWTLATESWGHLFKEGMKHCQQFLYYIFVKGWSRIFPANDYWIRIPSLLFGLTTIFALFQLGKRIFKEEQLFLQGAFFLLFPQFVFYSTYARPYALLVFFSSLNLFFLNKCFFSEGADKKDKHFFFLGLVGVLFTHHIGAIYVIAILLGLILFKKKLGNKIELIPYEFFLILYFVQLIQQKSHAVNSVSWIEPLAFGDIFRFLLPNNIYAVFYLFPLIGLATLFKKKEKNEFHLFNGLVIVLFFIGISLASFLITPLFTHRHFYILLPSIFTLFIYGAISLNQFKSFVYFSMFLYLVLGGHLLYTDKVFYEGRPDAKNFVKSLKGKVNLSQGFHCTTWGALPLHLKNYSKMHYPVDICKKYSDKFEGDLVILIDIENSKNKKVPAEYSVLHKFSNYTVYKWN